MGSARALEQPRLLPCLSLWLWDAPEYLGRATLLPTSLWTWWYWPSSTLAMGTAHGPDPHVLGHLQTTCVVSPLMWADFSMKNSGLFL